MIRKLPLLKILLILWLVFSVLYVGYNEWSRFKNFVMQRSYSQGVADAVNQVLEEAKTCKAFPINLGENKANLVNVDCLKQAEEPTKK